MSGVEAAGAVEPEQVVQGPAEQVDRAGELPVGPFKPGPVGLRLGEFQPDRDVFRIGRDAVGTELLGRLKQRGRR